MPNPSRTRHDFNQINIARRFATWVTMRASVRGHNIMKLIVAQLVALAIMTSFSQAYGQSTPSYPPDTRIIKDWLLSCPNEHEPNPQPCVLYHRVLLDNGYPLIIFQITRSLEQVGDFLAIFDVPLGVYLPEGIMLTIDNGDSIKIEFERCDQNSCYAGTLLSNEVVSSLKKGQEATLTFVDVANQKITATISLSGVTSGFESL